jgi:major inositol transporter-like SP family MFS transporter
MPPQVLEQSLMDPVAKAVAAPAPLPRVMYAFIGVAAAANLLFGYENSIISGARTAYASETGLDAHGASYGFLSSALPAGATVACVFAGIFQEWLGRRRTLALCCVAYIAATLVSFSAQSFAQLAAGRVLTGLSVGVFSSTAPMYIAELSPPAQRGQLVTVNQVAICTGVLLGYLSSALMPGNWRWQLLSGAPLALVLCAVFLFFMPFSPRWLMTKGREDEAREILARLRAGEDEAVVAAELDGIREACSSLGGAGAGDRFYAKLRERHVLWSIAIGVAAATMQQWSGVNAVNMYTSDVFKAAGFSGALLTQLPILIGVAKLVFVIVALALMDRVGRKPLLLVGCAGMVVSLGALGFALQSSPVPRDLGILATASLVSTPILGAPSASCVQCSLTTPLLSFAPAHAQCAYMAFFEVSLGPVLWLLLSELFPLQVKGFAMGVGSFTCWFFTCVVSQVFSTMSAPDALGEAGSFYFFAACCAASFVWIYFFVFETKGKSLEEIETELRSVAGSWEALGSKDDGEA